MNDNNLGSEQSTHKKLGCGIMFPVLFGFFLVLAALPIAAWKAGQKRWHDLHR